MLKQRVITALLLLAVLLPALFSASPLPFCALALLLISAGGWEWGRLNGCGPGLSWLTGLLCFVAGLLAWQLGLLNLALPWLWSLVGAAWVLGGAWLLLRGLRSARRVARLGPSASDSCASPLSISCTVSASMGRADISYKACRTSMARCAGDLEPSTLNCSCRCEIRTPSAASTVRK